MNYTLNIIIDSAILPSLADANYSLCVAKKVNNAYTVVWQGTRVLYSNTFSWSSQYQVFGTMPFQSGALVRATTETQNIQSGEYATLDKYGIMHPAAGTADNSGKFSVQNDFGLINIGVNCFVNGSYAPSYVSPNPLVSGSTLLQPVEKVLVWFDSNVQTGTMMQHASSSSIELDYTSETTHTLRYTTPAGAPAGRGVWVVDGGQPVLTSTYFLGTNHFEIDPPSEAVISLMTSLLNNRTISPPRLAVKASAFPSVASTVEYAQLSDVGAFYKYALAKRPAGLAKWDVSQTDKAVLVTAAVEVAKDEQAAVSTVLDAYLDVLYSYTGSGYTKLVSVVNGPTGDITKLVDQLYSKRDSGVAIISFANTHEAAAFVKQVNGATGANVEFSATGKGNTVTLRLSSSHPSADVDGNRKKVQEGYDAAVTVFESLPGGGKPVYAGPITWEQ